MKKIKAYRTFSLGEYSFIENEIYELPMVVANGILTMKLGEEVIEEKPKKKKPSKKDNE